MHLAFNKLKQTGPVSHAGYDGRLRKKEYVGSNHGEPGLDVPLFTCLTHHRAVGGIL